MNKPVKALLIPLMTALIATTTVAAGCTTTSDDQAQRYIVSIEQTATDGLQDIYTITYSDGTTSTFTVTNGEDGKDGEDASIEDIYEQYKLTTGNEDMTFEDFLSQYLSYGGSSSTLAIQKNLSSVMKIYTEFVVSEYFSLRPGMTQTVSDTALYTGSAVIYDMDRSEDGYTYIVTNYHVVYLEDANATYNGGTKTARKIYGYMYGSEDEPATAIDETTNTSEKDENGYTVYDYGEYAIPLEYIGGSVTADIAVLRTKTSDILAISPDATDVTLADGYHVGEAAIAIGNPESLGISVTEGIISVIDDYISLNIDGTARSYRSIRIDTALYSGNSGGGLFNADGELIGITNAGNTSDENINYAVPLEIVTGTADNIIYRYEQGDDAGCAYKIVCGITVDTKNSCYVYDSSTGYGKIYEDVVIKTVESGSVAEAAGLVSGDILEAIVVNGEEREIARSYDISDIILTLRDGDEIGFIVTRGGERVQSSSRTLTAADFVAIA